MDTFKQTIMRYKWNPGTQQYVPVSMEITIDETIKPPELDAEEKDPIIKNELKDE